jgi:CHAD domain-containing protein
VLRHARRIEAVHQLRVGARRLRSALSLFKAMVGDDRVEAVKGELKWLTHELDDARNLDVFIADSFRPAARRHRDWEGLAALGRGLIAAQTRAYDRVEAAVAGERFRRLMIETAAWIEMGPWATSDDPQRVELRRRPAKAAAREILDHRYRRVARGGRKLAKLAPHPRHELRIDAKKLRYACGFFADLYGGKRQRRFVEAMEGLQDALGTVTDIAAAGSLTARLAGADADHPDAAAELAFAAGLVAGERQGGAADAVADAEKAFRRFGKAEPFWRD